MTLTAIIMQFLAPPLVFIWLSVLGWLFVVSGWWLVVVVVVVVGGGGGGWLLVFGG